MTYSQKLKLFPLVMIAFMLLLIAVFLFLLPEKKVEGKTPNQFYDTTLFPISPVYFPQIEVLATKITFCESSNRHEGIWGDKGKAYGIAQFHEDTFYWMAELAGLNNPDWKNQQHQEYLLRWALMNDLGKNWTCY